MGELGSGPVISWYDVLGVLPGAPAAQIQRQYESKASLLRSEFVVGAPSPVVTAASRAQGILDNARRVLGDPANRACYDEAVGIRRTGGGLARHEGVSPPTVEDLPDLDVIAGDAGPVLLGGLMALLDWLTPHRRELGPVIVPDVRGLFCSACFGIIGKLGFRITVVRLTEHPMPVDGLVVDQSPRPPMKTRRGSLLTVHVWHPPARANDLW